MVEKSSDRKELVQVTLITLKAFASKAPSPETRGYYFSALGSISVGPNVSYEITKALPALIQKETSDALLYVAVSAYMQHFVKICSTGTHDYRTSCFDFIMTQLTSQQRVWIVALGTT